MPKRMYLFVSLFALVILFICFFTSFIYIHSFGISGREAEWLYAFAFFVTCTFVVAFATSRHSGLKGRNLFYIFAMTIAGYGMYLFITSIPLAIALALFSFSGSTVPVWIPTLFFGLGLVLGIIGHIQAWHISITEYSVKIPDLPTWWHNKRAVLVTDTHFGLVRKERFAEKIVTTIKSLAPDVVFHGGDFYDGPDITTKALTAIWKTLADTVPIFYTPGNHEEFGNYKAFIASVRDAGITVLEDKKTLHEGMQIAGITYRSKKQAHDASRAIETLGLDTHMPTILINHPPTFHETAHKVGVSLMLSGHTHNGQLWPGAYFARMVYGPYTYGMKKYKGLSGITSRGVGTAGPPFRLFNAPELVVIRFKNTK